MIIFVGECTQSGMTQPVGPGFHVIDILWGLHSFIFKSESPRQSRPCFAKAFNAGWFVVHPLTESRARRLCLFRGPDFEKSAIQQKVVNNLQRPSDKERSAYQRRVRK